MQPNLLEKIAACSFSSPDERTRKLTSAVVRYWPTRAVATGDPMRPNAMISQPTCPVANGELRDQNGRSGSKSGGL
jgi:hypothetical protein